MGLGLCEVLHLWLPASLAAATDWMRPILFNLYVSSNIKASVLTQSEAELEEDAVGLAIMSLNLILFATAYGFNGAVDSYASIAFGAGNTIELWAILYRQAILLCGLSLLAGLLLFNSERLFVGLGMESDLAHRAATLLRLLGWAVPGDFAYDALGRWMRAQQMHRIVAGCSLLAIFLNVGVNLSLASVHEPVHAPLLALVAQNTSLPLLLAVGYAWSRRCSHGDAVAAKETLTTAACALKALRRSDLVGAPLWAQLRTALAALLWTCAELWAWELQVFEASALGPGNAAAYTLLSSTYSLLISTVAVSVGSAASALIGEALGKGDAPRATALLRTSCALALCLTVGYTLPLVYGRRAVAALLSGGVPEVEAAYARTLPLILAMHLLDGQFNVFKAWLTVRRKQAFGAVMSVVIYYCLGVPLGFALAFFLGWHIVGLWAGLGLSVALGAVAAGAQATLDAHHVAAADPGEELGENDIGYVEFVPAEKWPIRSPGGTPNTAAALAAPCTGRSRRAAPGLAWLSALLAPGVFAIVAVVAWEQPWQLQQQDARAVALPEPRESLAEAERPAPLQGSAQCVWSTGGAFYAYPFIAYWDLARGSYGWEVAIANKSVVPAGAESGRRLLQASAAAPPQQSSLRLRLGHAHDVYDEPYLHPFEPTIEVGWAAWLRLPKMATEGDGAWTTRAMVGTRVSLAEHTFCGCQYMRGDSFSFRLTEHGRAQLPLQRRGGASVAPWYVNMTRAQINAEIVATCEPLLAAQACPPDNETAWGEWAAGSTAWVLPPWLEIYAGLPS